MSKTNPSFRLSTLRMLLLNTAAFILLSASLAIAESRRCYWCGPLAEQVHRSRRAPPCDSPDDHITTCELGLNHCATVATSPPHIESRYCIKLYQDECYPLFCNTTKTWKMTCPCRGDLCNGPNTEREIEAFEILSRLVAKTHNARIKKRTIKSSSKFIQSGDTRVQIIISNSTGAIQNDISNENANSHDDKSMQADEPDSSIHIEDGNGEDAIGSNDPTELNTETSKSSNIVNVADPEEKDIKQQTPSPETIKEIELDNLSEVISATTETSLTTTEIDKNNAKIVPQTTQTDENTNVSISVKSTEELPTAEALQHNVNAEGTDEKTTEIIKTEPTYGITQGIVVNTTPKARAHGKNNAGRVCISFFLLVYWVILYSLL